ncbi:HTH-type transcriptional repressor NsrR [Methylorubrum extorquens]
MRLARDAREIRLGRLVADQEGVGTVVDCRRDPCPLLGRCRLKWAFDAAEQAFFLELDRLTLADVVAGPTAAALRALFLGEPGDGGATPVPTDPTPGN